MLPLRDRPLTPVEVERMRLLLSTFRDGSGQSVRAADGYMPDYLDFERVTAYVCGGTTNESKNVFDVSVPGGAGRRPFGVSCKMAGLPSRARPSWFIEMSNSSKAFHDAIKNAGVHWTQQPELAGPIVVDVIEGLHDEQRGTLDVDASKYLLLAHDTRWQDWELAIFDLNLQICNTRTEVEWEAWAGRAQVRRGDPANRIVGFIELDDRRHALWEFYGNAGGQLKYYPLYGWEAWRSGRFQLEEPPIYDLRQKVDDYWPGAWPV
jgi:hypothetical protein